MKSSVLICVQVCILLFTEVCVRQVIVCLMSISISIVLVGVIMIAVGV